MAANSNHYVDVAKWVEKIIDSCQTREQIGVARKCVQLFESRMRTEAPDDVLHYVIRLNSRLVNRVTELYLAKINESVKS